MKIVLCLVIVTFAVETLTLNPDANDSKNNILNDHLKDILGLKLQKCDTFFNDFSFENNTITNYHSLEELLFGREICPIDENDFKKIKASVFRFLNRLENMIESVIELKEAQMTYVMPSIDYDIKDIDIYKEENLVEKNVMYAARENFGHLYNEKVDQIYNDIHFFLVKFNKKLLYDQFKKEIDEGTLTRETIFKRKAENKGIQKAIDAFLALKMIFTTGNILFSWDVLNEFKEAADSLLNELHSIMPDFDLFLKAKNNIKKNPKIYTIINYTEKSDKGKKIETNQKERDTNSFKHQENEKTNVTGAIDKEILSPNNDLIALFLHYAKKLHHLFNLQNQSMNN